MADSLLDRIRERVVVDAAGCWVWQGATLALGYGRMTVGSRTDGSRRTGYVHRFAYEAMRGPIPDGLHLDHLCRNRACCNPDHLEPVTRRTNTLRGVGGAAINARKTHCLRGHPFEGPNLVLVHGTRRCRECHNASRRVGSNREGSSHR